MKFYFVTKDGNRRKMKMSEVREHMGEYQIQEAKDAKRADPDEEVSYMTIGGYIIVEF